MKNLQEAAEPGLLSRVVHLCGLCMWQLNVPKEADSSQSVNFRSLLLNKCQQEFEKDKVEELDIAERQKLIDDATSVCS